MNGLCPVCLLREKMPPNGVCAVCFERIQRIYLHDRTYWTAKDTRSLEIFHKGQKDKIDPAVLERNISYHLKDEAERWARITQNGLSAVFVMIEILDDMDTVDLSWHRRRVAFMRELVSLMDGGCFKPATRLQVDAFADAAVAFWEGRLSKVEAEKVFNEMKNLLGKKHLSDWDSHSLLLWMILEQENFDWMWYQWFESLYDAIPDVLSDEIWQTLLRKHFSQEIQAWAEAADIGEITNE